LLAGFDASSDVTLSDTSLDAVIQSKDAHHDEGMPSRTASYCETSLMQGETCLSTKSGCPDVDKIAYIER